MPLTSLAGWHHNKIPNDLTKCENLFKSVVKKELLESPQLISEHQTVSNNNPQENVHFFNLNSDFGSKTIHIRNKADLITSNFFAEGRREKDLLDRYPISKEVFIRFNTNIEWFEPLLCAN